MTELYDVAAIGNAIVDVIAPATDEFLVQAMDKGSMMLVDETRSAAIYAAMAPWRRKARGGSAGNTIAGSPHSAARPPSSARSPATNWRSSPMTCAPSAPTSTPRPC